MFQYNQVIHGDCNDVLTTVPDESVDLVVTDPPYFVGYRDRFGRSIANDGANDHSAVLGAFDELYRVLRPHSYCISFYGWQAVGKFFNAWIGAGFIPVGHIVWHKNYASRRGVLRARHEQAYVLAKGRPAAPAQPLDDVQPWIYSGNKNHPTEKSVEILAPLVRTFSREGAVVLDSFCGSGSTLIAAAIENRRYVGIDLDANHVATAQRRLQGIEAQQRSRCA